MIAGFMAFLFVARRGVALWCVGNNGTIWFLLQEILNRMVSFGDRLREERVRMGLNQTEFGELAGVTKKSQMLYEADERAPDARYLLAITEAGANVLYILTGLNQEVTGQSNRSTSTDLPPDEQLLLDAYRGLSAANKKELLASLLTGDAAKKPTKGPKQVFHASVGQATEGAITNESGVSFNFGVGKTKE